MKRFKPIFLLTIALCLMGVSSQVSGQSYVSSPEKSWVFWYWMQASVSEEGITADLEAMKAAGIAGAYLMPIKGPTDPPHRQPVVAQLSPVWWDMVKHAMNEAKRLDLEIAMHASDGFALAGGPWITPELSMQKVVWSTTHIKGGKRVKANLPQPEGYQGYYEDIATWAYPTLQEATKNTYNTPPKVTTSTEEEAGFLIQENNQERFRSEDPCWIQYQFEEPFTCRSIRVITQGNNYQSHRLVVKASEDGKDYKEVFKMQPPRHGWQDTDAQVTYAIPEATAQYFRFYWAPEGTEPGAEDLDAAKWSPRLKIAGIEMSGAPKIHQYEGKSGAVWRISPRTTNKQLPEGHCMPKDQLIDVSEYVNEEGKLNWKAPKGDWTIIRMGHTSTGHTNATGGGGKGLECDKFNPKAINTQFDNWYGEIVDRMGEDLVPEVLKIFHIDSWECGSQNWSPVFRKAFKERRGYDLVKYLPVMAGIPIENAAFSEKVLYDVRQTIEELLTENFFNTMAKRAHEEGVAFTAESVAPTMLSDGMHHYNWVDIPMGEFWLRSPTHDKPNDMLDAISGAHIYGKSIIQAEAFTELRMAWDEHPGMLKALGDRNYALGVNKMVYHVYTHNPWLNRQPGMTLDGVGLYFQRDQTWWEPGSAWVKYAERCQKLLQQGRPVVDVAVFTGEELPRRAILPDRLVPTLPGIFGEEVVAQEKERLANVNQPQREMPAGVTHSANMADPEDWVDPLNGYTYDSFNKDALLRLAKVDNGKIILPGGASYDLLVLPQKRRMSPGPQYMSVEVAEKLLSLVKEGATVLISKKPQFTPGIAGSEKKKTIIDEVSQQLWAGDFKQIVDSTGTYWVKQVGKGQVVKTPFEASSFAGLKAPRDFMAIDASGHQAKNIAWTHRKTAEKDIYFVSNQLPEERIVNLSLRVAGKVPELYDAVTDQKWEARQWTSKAGRTALPVKLPANGSLFIILEKPTNQSGRNEGQNWLEKQLVKQVQGPWQVKFEEALGGPKEQVKSDTLFNWVKRSTSGIKHYSGTAQYTTTFTWEGDGEKVWLDLGRIHDLASIKVNGVDCGVAWTAPYQVDVSAALKQGTNTLEIAVANTWRNRLKGDHHLPEEERITWTTAPYRLEDKPLLDAGLLGPVKLLGVTE